MGVSREWLMTIMKNALTARDNHPDEVHGKEVEPEVVCFRSTVIDVFMV